MGNPPKSGVHHLKRPVSPTQLARLTLFDDCRMGASCRNTAESSLHEVYDVVSGRRSVQTFAQLNKIGRGLTHESSAPRSSMRTVARK